MNGELRGVHLRRNPTKKREYLLPTLLLSIVTLRRVSGASHALVETRRREATREQALGSTRPFGNDEFRRESTIFVRVAIVESGARVRRDLLRRRCRTNPNQRLDFLLCKVLFQCICINAFTKTRARLLRCHPFSKPKPKLKLRTNSNSSVHSRKPARTASKPQSTSAASSTLSTVGEMTLPSRRGRCSSTMTMKRNAF